MGKIKNPEKYIEKLKGQLAEARRLTKERYQDWINEKGLLQVSWAGFTDSQTCGNKNLGSFRAGDTVLIVGTVTKVEETFDPKCNNRSSRIEYIVNETRKKD